MRLRLGVAESAGVDEDGARPRFHVGHLLRIDGEYLRVTAIDRTANRLTVLRGVGGTRATAHLRDATIETYAPAPAIRDLCRSLCRSDAQVGRTNGSGFVAFAGSACAA